MKKLQVVNKDGEYYVMVLNIRQTKILKLLQEIKETTTQYLSSELKVSVRTIRSDIQQLKILNYQIVTSRGNGGGIRWID